MARTKKPAAKRKRVLVRQGDELPVTPCPLGRIPIGAAVLFDGEWWLVTAKISGHSMLRHLVTPPSDPAWSASPSVSTLCEPETTIDDAEWPVRVRGDEDAVIDPVSKAELDDGDLFKLHAWER